MNLIKHETINALTSSQEFKESAIRESARKAIEGVEFSAKEKVINRIQIKVLEIYLDEIKKNLLPSDEDVKLTGNILGTKVTYGAVSTDYKYDEDFEYQQLKNKMELRKEQLKDQNEQYRKFIEKGGKAEDFTGIVEDGEQIPVVTRTQTHGIKISIPKE